MTVLRVFTPTAVQAVADFMSTLMSPIVNQHLINAIKNADYNPTETFKRCYQLPVANINVAV